MGDQMGLQESFNTKPLYVSDNISYNMSDEDEVLDIIFNSMSDFCEPKTKYEEGIPGHIHNYKKQSTIPTTPTQKKIPLTGAERIKKLREKRSEEEIKQNKATDQVRKAAKRTNMSEQKKKIPMTGAERMKKMRKKRNIKQNKATNQARPIVCIEDLPVTKQTETMTYGERDKQLDKMRKKKIRATQTDEEREFNNISKKHHMRKMRYEQNGKEHLIQNQAAKKGMRTLREKGRLMSLTPRLHVPHRERNKNFDTDLNDWRLYKKKSKKHDEQLKEKRPDIVCKLNEKFREIAEENNNQRKIQEEKDRKEKWLYNPEYDDYVWIGQGEPEYTPCDGNSHTLTKEEQVEYEAFQKRDLEGYRLYLEELKQEEKAERKKKDEQKKAVRKKKYEETKKALGVPLEPLPERALCEYEKIRENNIKEREDAMIASGFFSDILTDKNGLGIVYKESIDK